MKKTFSNWLGIGLIAVLMFSVFGLVAAQDATDQPFLGVAIEPAEEGALITEVLPESAADEADLQVDDIITAVDGEAVTIETLASMIQSYSVGDEITLTVLRDGESEEINLTLGAFPEHMMMPLEPELMPERPFLGVRLEDTDDGVRIAEVVPDSAAEEAGIAVDDILVALDETEVSTVQGVIEAVMGLEPGDTVALTVLRDGEEVQIDATLGSAPVMPHEFVPGMPHHEGMPMPHHDFGFNPHGEGMPHDFMPFASGVRLGVRFIMLDEQVASEHDVAVTEGALITEVLPDTPAEEAGLQVGDIVTVVADDVLDVERTLRDRLYAYEPGDVVTFDVLREGETLQLEVTLGQVEMHSEGGMPFFPDPHHDFFIPDDSFEMPEGHPDINQPPNVNA
jgi:S1-C subfamily serine protease